MNVVTLGKALSFIKQLTDISASTVAPVNTPPQKPEFVPSEDDCVYASPESEGVSSDMLCDYIEEIYNNKSINIQGLIVSRHGKTLLKMGFDSWGSDVWKCAFSQSKSVTTIAVGMLMEDGIITPNTTIADIFGKKIPALYKSKFKDMTLLHLLNMSSGAIFNELMCITTDNWVKGFFTTGSSFVPGEKFNYNSLNTYMLSAAVTVLTGKSMADFLDERLFKPLGITNYFWEKCPKGANRGGWGLFIKPSDLVKIGQMLLQNGEWEGKHILSEKYIKAATEKRIDVPEGAGDYDYGLQIWTARDYNGFLFNGMLGQNMFCFRDSGIIVAVNSGNTDIFQRNDIFPVTHKYFNRKFEDSLPRNRKGEKRLKKLTDTLSHYRPRRNKHLWERIFRKRNIARHCDEIIGDYTVTSKDAVSLGFVPVLMQVILNNYTKGTIGYSFGKDERGLYLIYKENGCEAKLHIGFDAPEKDNIEIMGEKLLCATVGEFRYNEDDDLVLKLRTDILEYPFTRYMKFIFREKGLEVIYRETPGRELLDGVSTDGVTKKMPAVLSSIVQSEGEQIITKLGNAFERSAYAIKNS